MIYVTILGIHNCLFMKIQNIISLFIFVIATCSFPQYSFAEEKIRTIPLIKTSTGLSGKSFNYLEGQPELRLLQLIIPPGLQTPIHVHPSPMLIHVTSGKLKHVRGDEINFFKGGDVFVESNNGEAHYIKNIGKKPAILHVGVISVVGVPTTIEK